LCFLLSRNDNQSINQAYNAALRSKTKNVLARIQNNVPVRVGWHDCAHGLLFQCACIINVTTQHVVLVHSGHHYRFIECNLFSPWYRWNIAHVYLINNHPFTHYFLNYNNAHDAAKKYISLTVINSRFIFPEFYCIVHIQSIMVFTFLISCWCSLVINYWFVVFPPFLSDQLYVTYGYVVVFQVVLSPVLEHNDKQICGTIIIVFIRKQHSLSSNYVMQIVSDLWTNLIQPHCYACPKPGPGTSTSYALFLLCA
jgi:hypothetical protein